MQKTNRELRERREDLLQAKKTILYADKLSNSEREQLRNINIEIKNITKKLEGGKVTTNGVVEKQSPSLDDAIEQIKKLKNERNNGN